MKRLVALTLLLLLLLGVAVPAGSQGPGLFVRTDCTTLTASVTGQTWCFDATAQLLKVWNGSAFAQVSAVLGANTFTGIQRWAKGSNIASGATLTPGTDGNYFQVTGTTTITAIASAVAGTVIVLEFQRALILTHNATSLILPNNGANITTVAGDMAVFVSEGAGSWRAVLYQLASSIPALVLNRTAADVVVSNTAVETNLYSFSVPGGTLSTTRRLRLVLQGQGQVTSNDFTIRLRYGATVVALCAPAAAALAVNSPTWIEVLLSADNATNAQIGHVFFRSSTSTAVVHQSGGRGTAAEDSTGALTLQITIQFTTAATTNNYTMEHAVLEQL